MNNINIANDKIENIQKTFKKLNVNISILAIGNSGYKIINNLSKESIIGLKKILITSDEFTDEVNNDYESIFYSKNDNMLFANKELVDQIKETLASSRILILTTSLSGRSAKKLIPLILEIANELNISTFLVISSPFMFEGSSRHQSAIECLEIVKKYTCSYIVISNDKLLSNCPDVTMIDLYHLANNAIKNCINSFVHLCLESTMSNVNFDELFPLINNKKEIYIGFGNGIGKHKISKAIESSLNSKIIDKEIREANNILINIIADRTTSTIQINDIINTIKSNISNKDLNILFNFEIDKKLRNEIQLNIIATWNKNENYFDYKNYLEQQENNKNLQQSVKIRNTHEFKIHTEEKNIYKMASENKNIYNMNIYHFQNNETNEIGSLAALNEDDDIPGFLK